MACKLNVLNLVSLLFLVTFSFLFNGCVPVYYASNAHNIPLLKEKHETRLNLGMTVTEDLAGPDVQAAFAAGKNVGIIANGTYLKGGSESSTWQGHGYLVEAGS